MSPRPLQKQSEAEIPIERREERSERLLRRRRRHSREVHGREKNGDKESQRITKEQKRKTQLRFSSGNLRVQSSFGETLLSIETVAGISEAQATFMLQPFHHSPQLCQTKANRLRLRHYWLGICEMCSICFGKCYKNAIQRLSLCVDYVDYVECFSQMAGRSSPQQLEGLGEFTLWLTFLRSNR